MCVCVYVHAYIYSQAISSMDCRHCFLTLLKMLPMLFLIPSFVTSVIPWWLIVTVTPQAFNMVPVVINHQN